MLFTENNNAFAAGPIFEGIYLKAGIGEVFSNGHGTLSAVNRVGTFCPYFNGDLGRSPIHLSLVLVKMLRATWLSSL